MGTGNYGGQWMVTGYPLRGQIWNGSLDLVKGTEIGKTRPALVISNDRNNELAETVTVIPKTPSICTTGKRLEKE